MTSDHCKPRVWAALVVPLPNEAASLHGVHHANLAQLAAVDSLAEGILTFSSLHVRRAYKYPVAVPVPIICNALLSVNALLQVMPGTLYSVSTVYSIGVRVCSQTPSANYKALTLQSTKVSSYIAPIRQRRK